MKEIKTRVLLKNIKKIDRAAQLSKRIRSRAAHRAKEQSDPKSAEVYAQEKVSDTVTTAARNMKQMILAKFRTSPSRQDKARNEMVRDDKTAHNPSYRHSPILSKGTGGTLQGRHRMSSVKQTRRMDDVSYHSHPRPGSVSPAPTSANRALRLKKPLNGRYVLPSIDRSEKLRWIGSHVQVRLPQHSQETYKRSYRLGNSLSLPSRSLEKRLAERSAKRNVSFRHRLSGPTSPTMLQASPPKSISMRKVSELAKPDRKLMKRFNQPVKSVEKLSRTAAAKPVQQMLHRRQMVQYARTGKRSMRHVGTTTRFTFRIAVMAAKGKALLLKSLLPLLGVSSSVLIVLLVIVMAAAIISSPFGIFVSAENKDLHVTSVEQIVRELNAEFVARLNEIERSHGYVDRVEIHYTGSADNTRVDNWSDIMAVFAVKTTMDAANGMDVATLDSTRVHLIEMTFWETNLIDTDIESVEHTETTMVVHEDGSTSEETDTVTEYILHITVTNKTAEQQADAYGFTDEQKELMEEMLSGEFQPLMQALLGKDVNTGLTTKQLEKVYYDLPTGELGNDAVRLALTRLGNPYSQLKAGQGDYTDCSYLIQWCYRQLGISLPRTAAEQARYCVENGLTISPDDLMPGDLVFWSYESNNRFMDITHAGIYAGDGKVVDASSSRGQVVYRKLFDEDKQVLFGRPNI